MNTSAGFHAASGGKMKSKGKSKGSGTKLPAGLSSRMKSAKHDQQKVPEVGLSAYGHRRKSKMRGMP